MTKHSLMLMTMLLIIAPAMAMSASVYKWTDENGVTHFGDRQPVGTSSETLNVRSGTASANGNSRPGPQQRLDAIREQQQQEADRQTESAMEEARRKQREANCATARTNLEIIRTNSRIRVQENGEPRYLTPEEIDEQKTKYEEIAAENCGSEDQ